MSGNRLFERGGLANDAHGCGPAPSFDADRRVKLLKWLASASLTSGADPQLPEQAVEDPSVRLVPLRPPQEKIGHEPTEPAPATRLRGQKACSGPERRSVRALPLRAAASLIASAEQHVPLRARVALEHHEKD